MRPMFLVLLLFAGILEGQTAPSRDFPLDSITIEGNRILSASAIAAASGLKPGQIANGAVFDAARDRLIATGYFDMVSYRYKPARQGEGYAVTFEVQEIDMLYPIRIDGLPASADEITSYLKAKDPLFTGKMPGTEQVILRTSNEIQQYLESKGHPAEVAGKVIAPEPRTFVIDFTPKHGLPAVSTVSFEGNRLISAVDLHNKIAEVAFGQPFTEDAFRALLQSQIVPLYEAKGYMRVTFPKITATPSTTVTGVDVTVTVDDGVEYKLSRVVVRGKSPEESERILRTAKIPKLTVANFDDVIKGAQRLQDSMHHQGYLDSRVTTDRKIDDAKKTVEFFLVVDEGPQYNFGKLTVNGLGLDGEAAIRKMWGVRSGDPFPQGYGDYFLSKVKEEGIFDNLGDTRSSLDIDGKTHVVNVELDFKKADPGQNVKKPGQEPGALGPPPDLPPI